MWGMSLGETLIMILIICAVLGVFVAVIFIVAKKGNANLEELLASIPEDRKEAVKAEPYQPMDGAGIKCATRGLLAAIDTKGESSKVRLVFYNEAREGFYDQTTTIRTSELNGKGYKLYDLVPCQMKYDKEYHIHEFKKIM